MHKYILKNIFDNKNLNYVLWFIFPDFNPENAKDCNQETLFGQHLLVCALQEMACLIQSLGTTASNLLSSSSKILLPLFKQNFLNLKLQTM